MNLKTDTGIAIVLTDPNKKIIWINEEFSKLSGYSLGEVHGKKPSIFQGPDTKPEVVQCIRKLLALKIPFTEKIINYRKNQEKYECLITVHPIFDIHQKHIAFLALEGDHETLSDETREIILNKPKYASSSLSKVKSIQLYKELMRVFREDAIYLNPNCGLTMLAGLLKTNTKYLSQVVNNETGLKFRDFLNTYRVNHFRGLIQKGQHNSFSQQGLALECGFKNKMSFYNAVKKITKFAPGAFISQLST